MNLLKFYSTGVSTGVIILSFFNVAHATQPFPADASKSPKARVRPADRYAAQCKALESNWSLYKTRPSQAIALLKQQWKTKPALSPGQARRHQYLLYLTQHDRIAVYAAAQNLLALMHQVEAHPAISTLWTPPLIPPQPRLSAGHVYAWPTEPEAHFQDALSNISDLETIASVSLPSAAKKYRKWIAIQPAAAPNAVDMREKALAFYTAKVAHRIYDQMKNPAPHLEESLQASFTPQ